MVAFQFNLNNDIKISKRDKLRLIQGLYFKKYQKVIYKYKNEDKYIVDRRVVI